MIAYHDKVYCTTTGYYSGFLASLRKASVSRALIEASVVTFSSTKHT